MVFADGEEAKSSRNPSCKLYGKLKNLRMTYESIASRWVGVRKLGQ